MWPVCQFPGQVIPGISCFYGNWIEDVRAGQFYIIIGIINY